MRDTAVKQLTRWTKGILLAETNQSKSVPAE